MPGVVPQDLTDAVLQALRASNCAQLFGDTWDAATQLGVQKFFADFASDSSEPQAVVSEIGESYQFMTAAAGNEIPYLADGILSVTVYAPGRKQARDLGKAIGRALNDAPLVWTTDRLMMMRMQSAQFIPNPPSGPGVPTMFVRQLQFAYQTQGQL